MEPVRIELTPEDIQSKTDSEKLDILVGVAFSTHQQVVDQRLILLGNGDPKKGLVHKVALHDAILKWVFRGVGLTAIIGALVKILLMNGGRP